MINFLPLGGALEIGANCYYLDLNETGIILDCGIHPRRTGLEALPRFDSLKDRKLDYVFISHAHQDHLSSLPFLIKKFPFLKIITTPQTRALAELTLHNSVSILKEQIADDNFEVFNHDEVDLLIKMIDYKAYNEKFEIKGYRNGEITKVEFYDAGHILGSACILIESNKNIFYTGDINLSDQPLIKGAHLPNKKINILIIETTYGSTDSFTLSPWDKESDRLASELNKIFNTGGSVLIPVFSLGKTQEILKTLWDLILKGKIANTDIYTGGLGTKINKVYDYNRFVVNMKDPEFELSSIPQKNFYNVEDPGDFFKSPCIVLASSGMMIEGTASYKLAKRWIKQKNAAIFTVGYMEESTPGYKFANSSKGEKIKLSESEPEEEIKCSIKKFSFTAHSRREDLLKIVAKLKPEHVILVHGDDEAIDWVGSRILKEFKGIKVHRAETGKEILLQS
jgi:cleavage and polyadenylation specificity factor subunit 3